MIESVTLQAGSDRWHGSGGNHDTVCCTISARSCGRSARCFATRSRRKAATDSSISLMSRQWDFPGPDVDAELIDDVPPVCGSGWGSVPSLTLEINSLGTDDSSGERYRESNWFRYFSAVKSQAG